MATVRIKIDVAAGIAELDGEESFVATQLEKLLPLLQQSPKPRVREDADEDLENGDGMSSGLAEIGKKKRKAANPPKGTSCRARILELKRDSFFKSQRAPLDIVTGLKAKGWTHNSNQVGAALTNMFAKGEIQRTGADGKFMYYWDRG